MQTILDRYKVGVEVVGINLQRCRPRSRCRRFDDVLKAGRSANDPRTQAYANDVIPRAVGSASLKEELKRARHDRRRQR
jgi:membrane protease subunit HflK